MKNKYKFLGLLGLLPFFATAQLTNSGATIMIESGAKLIVEGDITNTSGTINNSGTIEVKGDFDNQDDIVSGPTSVVIFSGEDADQLITTNGKSLTNVEMRTLNGRKVILQDEMTITANLNFLLANNKIEIGNNNLIFGEEGTITNADTDKYIVADAATMTGKVSKVYSATEAPLFKFEIGDATTYSPLTADLGSAATGTIDANVEATASALLPLDAEDYLERTWNVNTSDFGTKSITLTGQYVTGDIAAGGDAMNIVGATFDDDRAAGEEWEYENASGTANTVIGDFDATGVSDFQFTGTNSFRRQAIKVFLAGAYNGTNMNTGLNDATTDGLIPSTSPYDNSVSISGTVKALNPNIVDWVEVELRDATDESVVLASYSKFLLNDGSIVNPSTASGIATFRDAPEMAYVAVKHRNHLGVMSGSDITLGMNTLDFTNSATSTFGSDAQDQLTSLIRGMYAGDSSGDGFIQGNDINDLIALFSNTGYILPDANLDGFVQGNDLNILISNFSKSQQF